MSNYPPGVSGNEWAIAGPSYERDEERTCEQEDVTLRVLSDDSLASLQREVENLRAGEYPEGAAARIANTLTSIEEVTVPECPFEGEVTVWGGDDGLLHWTCPVCGFEHDEEPDTEDIDYDPRDDI